MSREIKFRAWIKKGCESKMGEVTSINLDEGYINYIVCNEQNEIEIIGLAYLDEYILLQYTGLKDKNGKEIYVGDIVILNDAEEENRCVVEYKYGSYILVDGELRENLSNVENRFLEVIGNIYENPELLGGGGENEV